MSTLQRAPFCPQMQRGIKSEREEKWSERWGVLSDAGVKCVLLTVPSRDKYTFLGLELIICTACSYARVILTAGICSHNVPVVFCIFFSFQSLSVKSNNTVRVRVQQADFVCTTEQQIFLGPH